MPTLKFPGQQPDEQEVYIFRRHKIIMAEKIFLFLIEVVIPLIIYYLLTNYTDWLEDNTSILYIIFVVLAGLYYLYIILFLFQAWIDYYLDIWIITNERIISIEQLGLFKRTISELRINRVQDVTSEVHGFLPTIFKYGNVSVQTASSEEKFNLWQVPHPDEITRKIMALQEKYIKEEEIAKTENNQIPPQNTMTNKDEAKPV